MRSVALLDWHVEPDDPTDPMQVALAEEMTKILQATPNFMQYRESLLWALWYGRAAVQQRLRWKRLKKGEPLRVVVNKWKPINGDKLAFRYDESTGEYDKDSVGVRIGAGLSMNTIMAWSNESRERVLPTDWGMAYFVPKWQRKNIVIHKHMVIDGEWDDPYTAGRIHGVGIRSRIYWNWYQMTEILAWMLEYLERSAFGTEIWYYPYGNDEAKQKTMQAAQERIGGGRNIILVPRPVDETGSMSYGVERIENGMAGVDQLKSILIDFFSHSIKHYILGQTLTSEADSSGSGNDLAAIHLNTFMQIVRYDCTNLQETVEARVVAAADRIQLPRNEGDAVALQDRHGSGRRREQTASLADGLANGREAQGQRRLQHDRGRDAAAERRRALESADPAGRVADRADETADADDAAASGDGPAARTARGRPGWGRTAGGRRWRRASWRRRRGAAATCGGRRRR